LWAGAPPTGLRFYAPDAELIPFSVLWVTFVGLFNYAAWSTPGDWFMRIWGIPFCVYGSYILLGRFMVDAWVRRRQRYFVTNKRALITRAGWRGGQRSLSLEDMPFIKVTERPDGSGDVRLGPATYRRGKWGKLHERGQVVPALSPTPQFLGIADVASVFHLIERENRGGLY
jgi:hypothetical protein